MVNSELEVFHLADFYQSHAIGINIFIHDKLVCYNTHKFGFNMTGFGNKLSLY